LWTKWHWDGFSPSTSASLANSHYTDCSTFIIIIIHHPGLAQETFVDYYMCREPTTIFRILLSPYSLTATCNKVILWAVPYLRRLVAGFPPRRPWFEPRSGHVGFVVDKVVLGQVFSQYFGFSCQFSFHRLLHIHHHHPGLVKETFVAYYMCREPTTIFRFLLSPYSLTGTGNKVILWAVP
jgi:hypothetical protein